MSDNNYKDYDLSIFEEPQDNAQNEGTMENIKSHSASDYGDDFYTQSDSFEVPDETQVFTPVKERETPKKPEHRDETSQLQKKNYIIIALSISLALVVFIFSLIFFLGSSDDDKPDKKKPTTSTVATETVKPTETQAPTELPTEEPTQPPTQEETQALTQAVTEPPTEAPTEAPTAAVETESEYVEPTTELVVE